MACNIVDENEIRDSFSCGICHGVLTQACRPKSCSHVFCKECLYNWYNQKRTCPMCVRPFVFSEIVFERKLQRDIESFKTCCEGCDQLIYIKNIQSHRPRCPNTHLSLNGTSRGGVGAPFKQSTLNSSHTHSLPHSQVKNSSTLNASSKLTPPPPQRQAATASAASNLSSAAQNSYLSSSSRSSGYQAAAGMANRAPNRYTFACPYCNVENLTCDDLREHCNKYHRDGDKNKVCPICKAMPWGDPNYKSIDFITHLNWRHKFEYDKYVNFELNDDEALVQALMQSLRVY